MNDHDERHVPVLSSEVLEFLKVRRGGTYADATLGLGGHSSLIARRLGPQGRLICFDRDPEAMEIARDRLHRLREELGAEAPEIELVEEEFSSAAEHIEPGLLDGLLADFGISSLQLSEAHRGFSFQAAGPLDMRMNPRKGITAEQVVNQYGEKQLADLIYEFGEERRSRRIARAVVRARPITTTAQLAAIVAAAAPAAKEDRIHPATRTFQAIRIHVNGELDEITALLAAAPKLLKQQGRLAVISFHSLEDRLVKDAFREGQQQGIYEIMTRKPVVAGEDETSRNPRSRSAKLRAVERLGEGEGSKGRRRNKYRPG